ncbi:MAG: hypothetical protein COB66_04115 [Coxiella sp. (in: Bacteria)]|nr:MAG: hypothetical protein COB66_04115 [Coxiella sp. (in: g-proteobacteria)]
MQQLIGNIALNISFLVYLVLYLPQVIHNLRRRSTEGLSFLMHIILVIGYTADMMYGFGRHMQWQYRVVSIVGLICLTVQHIQIGAYQKKLTANYVLATLLIVGWLGYALYAMLTPNLPARIYIDAGLVAWGTGVVYTLPQIWKNYRFASSMGVSILFIYFDIISSSCDTISAWCLNWDYPSKFGSPIECVLGLFLLIQVYFYYQKRVKLA